MQQSDLLGFTKVDCVTFKLDAGKKEMEKEIIMLEEQFPSAAKGVAEFSTPLAHQIIAGTGFDKIQVAPTPDSHVTLCLIGLDVNP